MKANSITNMNNFNDIFKKVQKRHLCIGVVTLLFLWVWFLCFPCLLGVDYYGIRKDQWGVGCYLLMQVANLPLTLTEWSLDFRQIPLTYKHFVYFGGCMATLAHAALLWYSLVSMVSAVCRHVHRPWPFVAAVAGIILTVSFLSFSKTTDLFFCATTAWVLSRVVKKYITGETFTLREVCMMIVFTAVAVSYRRNAVVIMPLLVWICLSLYTPALNWRPLKRLIVSCVVAVVAAFPLSSSLLVPVLDLGEMHGEEVFLSSDYALMRMLKGKPIELSEIDGIWHEDGKDSRRLFMQFYRRSGQSKDIKALWMAEIKDSPSTFLKVRGINFLQFLTIGCLPDFIREPLQEHYPDIYFPGAQDFRTITMGYNNFPCDYEEVKGTLIHTVKEFRGWNGLLECGLFKNNIFFRWSVLAGFLFVLYCVTLGCLIWLLSLRLRRKKLSVTQQLALWCGLLEFCYLSSFLVFTPTPDYRYHFFSILTGFLMIGFCALTNVQISNVVCKIFHVKTS